MISANNIDRLAIAIALNPQLQASFLVNRLDAIEAHNQSYARRYGEKPIVLNDAEQQLVTSVKADSLHQFYDGLAQILDDIQSRPVYLPSQADRDFYSEFFTGNTIVTAA